MAANWFQQNPYTPSPGGGAAGIMAPRQSAEDQRLLQDPAFQQQYGAWVQSQGPGAGDWATPTGYLQSRQQNPSAPSPGGYATPGAPIAGGPPQDYASAQAAFHQLFPGETLTPEMLKAHEAELNALGFQLRPNAQGQVGKIQWGNEPIVDVIQGAGSGLNRKQWLAGGPPGGGAGGIGAGLENTPGYQFRLGEGLKALERSAASRGTLLTGGTLKGLQKYAQDVASTEYGNRVNQLTGLANLGVGATGTAVGAGTMYGNQLAGLNTGYGTQGSDLLTQRGNAQAAGTVGSQNAWTQGINNAIGSGMNMYALSQLGNPAANPYGGGGPVNTGGPLRGGYGYPQPTWYPQGPPGMGV